MNLERARKRDLWEQIGAGPHPCHWCGNAVGWAEVAPLPPGVLELVVGSLEGRGSLEGASLVPACPRCWRRECAPRTRARAVPPSVPFPRDWGPRRAVIRELPRRRGTPQGAYVWCFILECGHKVSRRAPGKAFCYCEACRRSGPRIILSRTERTTVVVARRSG